MDVTKSCRSDVFQMSQRVIHLSRCVLIHPKLNPGLCRKSIVIHPLEIEIRLILIFINQSCRGKYLYFAHLIFITQSCRWKYLYFAHLPDRDHSPRLGRLCLKGNHY